MKHKVILSLLIAAALNSLPFSGKADNPDYPNNRYPLIRKPYIELPLGSIKPKGWLLEMLERQKKGASSQMDILYPEVMGARNGWLGGDGDQWERGPYWIDGLLPLAYILDDKELKQKVQPWIEFLRTGQRLCARTRTSTGQLCRLVAPNGSVEDHAAILFGNRR